MGEPVRDAEDEAPHVVVAVRLRPTDSEKVLEPRGNQLVFSYKGEEHRYCFDHVLDNKADQAAVFDLLGKPQLDKAFDGYNSTIFAYGQTGSGKTFTMLNVQGGEEELGLIPRISRYLFLRTADASSKTSRFLVQCSFLEIYNEVIYDLLAPRGDKGKGLEVREQKGLGVYVKDLTEEVVANTQHLDRLIAEGFAQRTTAATAMNDASSRSHCVFTICLHYQDTEDNSRNTISKLNLVDLAGSERNDSEVRKQLKEGANIKSLSALGNVINALSSASSSRRRAFVPYRDSKLTRVLQESLGGNAFCTMIATTCPSEGNSEETWHTLQYAKRAKTIRVAATRNEETKQRQQMEKEVEELRKSAEGREELEAQHRAEIEALEDFMKQTWEDKQRLTREHEEQRDLARLEVQRAMEQRKAEQQRRLEALEKLGDLHVTLQSWVASRGETGSRWPEHLVSVLRCPQQLQSQLKTVRLYRDGAVSDVELLKRDLDATSQLLLSQAQAKLQIMAKELAAAEQAEVSYKSQLCTLSAEIAVTLQEGKEQEVEGLELLQLVQLQLREHYAATSGQFLQEVAQLNFSLTQLGQRLRDLAEGADLPDLELEVAPDVLPLALGLASREVPDTQISASSHSHLASCARLQRCDSAGAWCPATGKEEFLEVDLQEPMTVVGIAMQGRVPCSGRWQQTHGLLQLALGSGEAPWVDRTFVRPPVRCVHEVAVALIQQRCFGEWREVPEAAKDFGAMTKESKLDFLSRLIQESSVKKLSAKPSGLDVEGLSDSEEEEVEPLQLTAQDILAGRNCTETNRMLQLMACRALGLGEAPHWTRRWRLQYQGPAGWQWYAPGQSDEAVDLEGNSDAQKVHFVQLEPIQTSRLRIYPVSWQLWPALRLEVFVLPRDAKLHAAPIFQKLQAHVGLALQGLDTLRRHIEAGMREDQLAKEQQAQEQGQLQSQLNEALARAASAEAALLQLRAENQRLQQLADTREAEAEAEARAEGQSLREECQRLRAAVEDFQQQLAVVWDERDVARKHEEELFYVISRKDEELLQVHKVLAELTQQAKERELADEAAELLGSEMAGYSEQIQELSDRCKQLEEENLDLRAERDRVNRKREKLSEQKHELQERLRLSETARQAARERCEQILQKVKQRDDPDALEDLRKSMEEFGPETSAPKPKLQRSRTVARLPWQRVEPHVCKSSLDWSRWAPSPGPAQLLQRRSQSRRMSLQAPDWPFSQSSECPSALGKPAAMEALPTLVAAGAAPTLCSLQRPCPASERRARMPAEGPQSAQQAADRPSR